jgi:hypothetical protein
MKTSNKLLLGLFAVVVLGIIIVNIILKKQFDSRQKSNIKMEVNSPSDTTSNASDSIAMENAISNE